MAEQILRITAGLFVGIWVARYLGPEQFGVFSYVLAFTAILGGIAKLGIDGIMVRELINQPELRDVYLGTAFWLKVAGALLVIALMVLIVPFTSNDTTINFFIFIIAVGLFFQSFEVVEFYFQSQVLAKTVSICKVIQLALSTVIKIYLVLAQAELVWFVLVTVFDAMSLAATYLVSYKWNKKTSFLNCFDLTIAKKLMRDSWPLIFSSLVVMISMRIDQIMIKEMLGEYDVGVYSAAVRMSEAIYFLPVMISSSLFPAIINAKSKSLDLYFSRMQKLYTLMVWLAIIFSIFFTFMSASIINLLFGESYSESAGVLVIHVWASVFVFLAVSSGKFLTAEGKTRKVFYRNFAGMASNIALNIILIPSCGLKGAAIATLIAWLIAGYLYDFFDKDQWSMAGQKTKAFIGALR